MGLMDEIRKEAKAKEKGREVQPAVGSTQSLIVEQKLSKLFFLDTNVEEETRFVNMIMLKNGAAKTRVGLHASAIIVGEKDFCYRQQVLSLFYHMSQGEHVSPGLKRIFEAGNSIHEKWQRLFIRGGLGSAEDMDRSRFAEEYDLSYTPDGADLSIGKHKYICEIKSVNTFQFKKMQSHPSGRKQLHLYMHLTGIHKGFVLCEDKNDQNFKVFAEDYDPKVVAPFIERLEGIQYYKERLITQRKMPKGICSDQYCKRAMACNMKDACFNTGMGRISLKEKLKR